MSKQNLIVSLKNLPERVKKHLRDLFPHGYDHEIFEFRLKDQWYNAITLDLENKTYLIKLEKLEG